MAWEVCVDWRPEGHSCPIVIFFLQSRFGLFVFGEKYIKVVRIVIQMVRSYTGRYIDWNFIESCSESGRILISTTNYIRIQNLILPISNLSYNSLICFVFTWFSKVKPRTRTQTYKINFKNCTIGLHIWKNITFLYKIYTLFKIDGIVINSRIRSCQMKKVPSS